MSRGAGFLSAAFVLLLVVLLGVYGREILAQPWAPSGILTAIAVAAFGTGIGLAVKDGGAR